MRTRVATNKAYRLGLTQITILVSDADLVSTLQQRKLLYKESL